MTDRDIPFVKAASAALIALAVVLGCGSSGGPRVEPPPVGAGGGPGGGGGSGGLVGGSGGSVTLDAAAGGRGGTSGTGGTAGSGGAGVGGRDGGNTTGADGPRDTVAPPIGDAAGAARDVASYETGSQTLPAPPATWQEHWFEHNQNVKLVAHDDHAAIYFDDDVPRTQAAWLLSFMSRIWQYSKKHYGDMGDPRVYSIHHQGRYGGGHPSYYYDSSHDNRNVSDCGPGPWNEGAYDIPSHEVAHVVESTAFGMQTSPTFGVWGDSKWAEIYQYDLYLGLGMTQDAQRLFTRFMNTTDSFPRAGSRWFRDWYYPLWKDRGGVQFLAKYFQLLAMHFPKNGKRYSRRLNFGEYVHFMCGAAGMDCKPMANVAFGTAWEAEYQKARTDFPGITY